MYSVVLMVAMTTGGDAVDCHRRRHHCHGGCSGAVASCSGGWAGSCSGGWYGGGCSGSYSGVGCGGGMPYGPGPGGPRPQGEPLKMPSDQKKEEIKKPV